MRYCSKWSLARSGVGGLTMKVELVINSDQIAYTIDTGGVVMCCCVPFLSNRSFKVCIGKC